MDGYAIPALYCGGVDVFIVDAQLLLSLRVILRLVAILAQNDAKTIVFASQGRTVCSELKRTSISIGVGIEIFCILLIVVIGRPEITLKIGIKVTRI